MHTFSASPVAVTGGCKPAEECFAAAAGFYDPEVDETCVHPNIPECGSVLDVTMPAKTRMVAVFASEGGRDVLESLASRSSTQGITNKNIEEALTVGCSGDGEENARLLSVVEGTKLVAAQAGAGRNSILRCSMQGHFLDGLVALPAVNGDIPAHTTLRLEEKDECVILGATALLEGFSQAQLVKIMGQKSADGTAAVAKALLKQATVYEIEETVAIIVLDVCGWASLHTDETVDPNKASQQQEIPSAEKGAIDGTKDMPASKDVAAGVATVAEVVEQGPADAQGAPGSPAEGKKEGTKKEVDPVPPWHQKFIGTAKTHWSTHKSAIMKFVKTRQKTASRDAKKLRGIFGKCTGGDGKDEVLHEDDPDTLPDSKLSVPQLETEVSFRVPVEGDNEPIPEDTPHNW